MKPKIDNGWIVTLAAFRSDEVSDEEWKARNPKERAEECTFSEYRIRPVVIYAYNEAAIDGCTTLRFGDGDSMTVTGTVEEFDKLLIGAPQQ